MRINLNYFFRDLINVEQVFIGNTDILNTLLCNNIRIRLYVNVQTVNVKMRVRMCEYLTVMLSTNYHISGHRKVLSVYCDLYL